MGWSLRAYEKQPEPLLDVTLLAVGKALHLANEFEKKCQNVLRIANLVAFLKSNDGADLDDAFAAASKDKMLAATLTALAKFPIVKEEDAALLDKARDARNFIAHEGGLVGPEVDLDEHLEKLRAAVRELAHGDNVVSRWIYEIEEKQRAHRSTIEAYPDVVDRWVFGESLSVLDDL